MDPGPAVDPNASDELRSAPATRRVPLNRMLNSVLFFILFQPLTELPSAAQLNVNSSSINRSQTHIASASTARSMCLDRQLRQLVGGVNAAGSDMSVMAAGQRRFLAVEKLEDR